MSISQVLFTKCGQKALLICKYIQYILVAVSTVILTDCEYVCGVQGMKRLYADIHDINVDVPAAYNLLDILANKLHSKHVLGESLMQELPSRYVWQVMMVTCAV